MDEGGDKKKVMMVAIDESECSRYALEWALNNLRESLQNSKLVIFTAQPLADYGYLYASSHGAAPAELVTSVQENHRRVAEALLAKAKEICSQFGISADTFTQVGEPKEAICEAVISITYSYLSLAVMAAKLYRGHFLEVSAIIASTMPNALFLS